jgi:hypothetical protein
LQQILQDGFLHTALLNRAHDHASTLSQIRFLSLKNLGRIYEADASKLDAALECLGKTKPVSHLSLFIIPSE